MALAFQIEEEGRVQIVRIYLASNTSQFSHDRQRERERDFSDWMGSEDCIHIFIYQKQNQPSYHHFLRI